jgi:hypothetical protein
VTDGLLAAALLSLTFTGIFVSGAYLIVRRIRRSLTLRRARLARQRLFSRSGARRELAGIRAHVLEATTGARSIAAMLAERDPHRSLRNLQQRLERLAAIVDQQLEIMSHEPDDRILADGLTSLRHRAEGVVRAATEVRTAASLLLEGPTDYELEALTEDARCEAEALRYGREVLARHAVGR